VSEKSLAVLLIIVAEVMVVSVWFSATAIIPTLQADYALTSQQTSYMTSAVSIGFVAGTLVSAVLGLADRVDARLLFALASVFAAIVNALFVFVEPGSNGSILLRFLTGMAMAGTYPIGMKLASSWASGDMGVLIGLLVGALTLGSALPHLLAALDVAGFGFDWRIPVLVASGFAASAAVLIAFVRVGPVMQRAAQFQPKDALRAFTTKSLRLANFGYFGHMWELYAFWGWIGLFLLDSLSVNGADDTVKLTATLVTFLAVTSGAIGSVVGGSIADRFGRTTLTIGALMISGSCCVLAGFLFGASLWIMVPFVVVWGIAAVADSAQFSSSVIELSAPELRGTMLTVQTCVGFSLTVVAIHLLPVLKDLLGWEFAFMFLAFGPFLGAVAMLRLRAHPDAERLAGGRR